MKKTIILIILTSMLFTSCSLKNEQIAKSNSTDNIANEENTKGNSSSNAESSKEHSSRNDTYESNKSSSSVDNSNEKSINEISTSVKDYIINGQNDVSEESKLKWSKSFLDNVDVKGLYLNYKANGGNVNDIKSFAKYITDNAKTPSNWEEMFKKDLKESYDVECVKLVKIDENLYQAYVIIEGKEIPYVVVSSRTGYFHG